MRAIGRLWSDGRESRNPHRRWFCLPGLALLAIAPALVETRQLTAIYPWGFIAVLFAVFAITSLLALWNEDGLCYYLASITFLLTLALWIDRHLMIWTTTTALAACIGSSSIFLVWTVLMRCCDKSLRLGQSALILPFAAVAGAFTPAVFSMLGVIWSRGDDSGILFGPPTWALCLMIGMICAELTLNDNRSLRILSLFAAIPLGVGAWSALTICMGPAPGRLAGMFCVFLIGSAAHYQYRHTGGLSPAVSADPAWLFASGRYLVLTGLILLCEVTVKLGLIIPTWRLWAVLSILAVGTGVAALAGRHVGLAMGAMALAQVCVLLHSYPLSVPLETPRDALDQWARSLYSGQWGRTQALASASIVLLSLALYLLFARGEGVRESRPHRVLAAGIAIASLVGAQLVAIETEPGAEFLPGDMLVTLHLLWTMALLTIAAVEQVHIVPLLASILALCAHGARIDELRGAWNGHGGVHLVWAAIENAAFLAYVLLHGRRVRAYISPYLAVVLSGVPLYWAGKQFFTEIAWQPLVVSLPILQAAFAVWLILTLRPIDTSNQKERVQLLLLSGAALIYMILAVARA